NCYSFITKDSSPPIPAVTSAARKSATPTTQRNCAPTQEGPRDQTLLSSFLAISSHAEPYARQLEEKRLNPPAPHPENPRLERNLRPAKSRSSPPGRVGFPGLRLRIHRQHPGTARTPRRPAGCFAPDPTPGPAGTGSAPGRPHA